MGCIVLTQYCPIEGGAFRKTKSRKHEWVHVGMCNIQLDYHTVDSTDFNLNNLQYIVFPHSLCCLAGQYSQRQRHVNRASGGAGNISYKRSCRAFKGTACLDQQ